MLSTSVVPSGRALYAGISAYNPKQTEWKRSKFHYGPLELRARFHRQPKYSMFVRDPRAGIALTSWKKKVWDQLVFSPLAQGLLSDRYLQGIPADPRAARDFFLKKKDIGEEKLAKIRALNEIAKKRRQTLVEMAVAWVLRDPRASLAALVGTSKVSQVDDNVAALKNLQFLQRKS